MSSDVKRWRIEYAHADGRAGTVEAETKIQKSEAFQYGNGKSRGLTINGYTTGYDLRYASGDLHRLMLEDYFGDGLVKATEIK